VGKGGPDLFEWVFSRLSSYPHSRAVAHLPARTATVIPDKSHCRRDEKHAQQLVEARGLFRLCARIHAVHWVRAVENLVLPGIYARSELIRPRIDRYKDLRFQVVSKLAIRNLSATCQGGIFALAGAFFFGCAIEELKDSQKFDLLVERGEPDANPRAGAYARSCDIRADQPESCGVTA